MWRGLAGMRGNLRRGKKLKVLLAEHAKWSQEQIDFAIKEVSRAHHRPVLLLSLANMWLASLFIGELRRLACAGEADT